MKVLVVGGCTTRAQVLYLKAAFPEWDIRGTIIEQATEWIASGHERFLGFLAELDLFFGLTDRPALAAAIPAEVPRLFVPSFDWSGFHPDTVWLQGVPSPMELGVINSRLAVAGWLAGLDEARTLALFNDESYERAGFYEVHAADRDRMEQRFRKFGIEIAPLFDRWLAEGNFLHTPNHPRTQIFFDIADAAMRAYGYPPDASDAELAAARASFPDYLAAGIVWPVYPEIAARFGIAAKPDRWRTSLDKGSGTEFDHAEMVRRTHATLATTEVPRERIVAMMGGPERVARYAGA